jgi:uncharacterized membrane protein YiaA
MERNSICLFCWNTGVESSRKGYFITIVLLTSVMSVENQNRNRDRYLSIDPDYRNSVYANYYQ